MRATGREQLMQVLWIYEHRLDDEGLRRFHGNFGYGMAGRLIERSTLPFGRHRWVSSTGPATAIDTAQVARPRDEVIDWADERLAVPIDPEFGPGWHLGVLPLTDGSTAVTLVISHHLTDGVGFLAEIADAADGTRRELGYPARRSRTRLRGVLTDLRQTAQAAPEVARTVVAAAKIASRQRLGTQMRAPRASGWHGSDGDQTIVLPSVAAHVDLEQWDARACELNGTSYSLLAGFAAKLAERLGRLRADGTVRLVIALNDRTGQDDTRAIAMLLASVDIDPRPVTVDQADARTAIRQALKMAREVPNETMQLLPLVPYVPKQALRGVIEHQVGTDDDLPVSLSNFGYVHPGVGRPDGTSAEYVTLRGVDFNVSKRDIERVGGQLVLVSGRIGGKISIGVVSYQPDSANVRSRLRELAKQTLADFALTGEIF